MENTDNIDTKDLILNAAEKLFAAEGYHGTSVRAITKEAGVNLASVNYHFGSKEALLEALFDERFGLINAERIKRLDNIMRKTSQGQTGPELHDVLRAFLEPVFGSEEGTGRLARMSTLIHMAHSAQDSTVIGVLIKTFMPAMEKMFKALCDAMPGIPENEIKWKMHFFIGGFSHTLRIAVMEDHGHKLPSMPTRMPKERLIEMMVSYFAAGMEAK